MVKSLSIILGLGICVSTVFSQEEKTTKEVDPSGTWRWEYDMQGETINDWAVLQKQKGGKVTGKFYSSAREDAFDVKGTVKGDKLTFETKAEFSGAEVDLEFTGKIKGDDLTGTVFVETDAQSMDFPWTPKRSVEMSDVVGEWELLFEAPDNEVKATLVVSGKDKKFAGVHSGDNIGDNEAKELKVKDNHLMYTVIADFNGSELVGKMKGRPYGNNISGTIEIEINGNEFELPFTGKRNVEKKKTDTREE